MKRRVLVVAAEPWELAPLKSAALHRTSIEYVFVAAGPGPRLAAAAVRSAGVPVAFDAFVSVGLCGALAPELKVADIVVGREVNGIEVPEPRVGLRYTSGPVASVDYVAGTVEEKRRLRRTGAIAVEMEAAAVLEEARAAARPCYCVKVVSDTADEGFVLDLNAARDQEGRFRTGRILLQAARSPVKAAPELARLYGTGRRALKALGEFFAECNF